MEWLERRGGARFPVDSWLWTVDSLRCLLDCGRCTVENEIDLAAVVEQWQCTVNIWLLQMENVWWTAYGRQLSVIGVGDGFQWAFKGYHCSLCLCHVTNAGSHVMFGGFHSFAHDWVVHVVRQVHFYKWKQDQIRSVTAFRIRCYRYSITFFVWGKDHISHAFRGHLCENNDEWMFLSVFC